jgi:DNA mismatch endonuclease, patch repair protein
MDVLTPEQRRRNMSSIRCANTGPERRVRSLLHRLGYRFRLHRKDLPGRPDIVFPSRRKVVLVHGCYWHVHDCKYGRVQPKTNADFWQQKRLRTVRRDQEVQEMLRDQAWEAMVVWECELRQPEDLAFRLRAFLDG